MIDTPRRADEQWEREDRPLATVVRNVSMRYVVLIAEMAIGLLMLPFNVSYLGRAAYGVWLLMTAITGHFSLLDLGFGGSQVRFVAHYRARRDAGAINEIVSTLFFVFAAVGAASYAAAALIAFNMERLFALTPEQAALGRTTLLIIALQVAMGFPYSVFGGIVNGFQRYATNSIVGLTTSIVVALVNVIVLRLGYGLETLVAATTLVRILALQIYRLNAYRTFPLLQVRPRHVRRARLREVTGFSVHAACIDWGNKLNYSSAPLVIGTFLNSAAVAVYGVPMRLAEVIQRLTNQLNAILFPVVVGSAAEQRADRLQLILLQGTRISLALVVPIGMTVALLAGPLVTAWVGPGFETSAAVLPVLAAMVIIRVGDATATTILKGAGRQGMLAGWNLAMAAANITLSIILVHLYGVIGVAMGALIPVMLVSTFVLFPAACHRVGLSVRVAVARAVWPSLWPAVALAAVVVPASRFTPPSLPSVAGVAVLGWIAYYVCFVGVAIGADDRRLYLTKAGELLQPIGSRLMRWGPASATTP